MSESYFFFLNLVCRAVDEYQTDFVKSFFCVYEMSLWFLCLILLYELIFTW